MTGLVPVLRGVRSLQPTTEYVVLLLHGGQETSRKPVSWYRPAVVRMLPFARALTATLGSAAPVLRLRYRVRGWNGKAQDPVLDGRWALDQVGALAPGARVILIGHSMGGRVGLRLLEDPRVEALVGLAPWVTPRDRAVGRAGQRVLFRHAAEDIVTDPRQTARMAEDLRALGVDVELDIVPGDNHAMLRHPSAWHAAAAAFVRDVVTGSHPTQSPHQNHSPRVSHPVC